MLEEVPVTWKFKIEDAPFANQAILVLFDDLLIPLFMSAPMELQTFFKQSKEARRKQCKKSKGLASASARQYERILAVVHVMSMLDVWRRNTGHFLV